METILILYYASQQLRFIHCQSIYLDPRFWLPSFQGRYVRILKSYAFIGEHFFGNRISEFFLTSSAVFFSSPGIDIGSLDPKAVLGEISFIHILIDQKLLYFNKVYSP